MSSAEKPILIKDETAMLALGKHIADSLDDSGCVLYLHGELGAGKTTLTRGLLQALGVAGKVKSPTYTLVEPYSVHGRTVYHFDLYRLDDPEELEFMGIRDYDADESIIIIEWPEQGAGFMPAADMDIQIEYLDTRRQLGFVANSPRGEKLLDRIRESGALSGQ